MVNVVHVCSAHPTHDSRVFHHECASLSRRGYVTHLIGGDTATAGYRSEGVVIHPLQPARTRLAHIRRRWKVARMAAELKPRLFHVHEPALLGPVLAVARGTPVVYDAHESYRDLIRDHDQWSRIPRRLRPFAAQCWDLMEQRYARQAAAVVTVTPQLAARFGNYHSEVHVVANYPALADWGVVRANPDASDTCVFAGGIIPSACILEVVRAIAVLQSRGITIRFRMAGPVRSHEYLQAVLETATQLGIGAQVEYCGVLDKQGVIALVRGGLCGIGLYKHGGNASIGVSRKQIEYMSAGIPVIGPAFGNFREVVGNRGTGILVDPESPEEIASAIERLVREPGLATRLGTAGREAALGELNWECEEQKLFALYEKLIGSPAVVD